MSRFLFVVPPLTGHTNPTLALGRELQQRGHAVAWTGHAKIIGPLLDDDARLINVGADPDDELIAGAKLRSQGLRGAAALQFLWEEFLLPLAASMVPGVEAAVSAFEPDVLIVDQQAIAGALVARRRCLPWVTSATTSAELVDPFDLLPKVGEWVASSLRQFQLDFGVPAAEAAVGDLRFSDHLVLAFTTQALAGPLRAFPAHYRFVGPSLGARPLAADFPWEWLGAGRQHVLVSLGTINAPAGRRFLTEAVEALGSSPLVQGVVVGPPDLGPLPGNVLVREFVPQLALLPHMDAVVSHAGHNTVCESLAHGLPLVVAPIRDDQPIVAQQVCDAGAAIRVKFGRVRAPELAGAIASVLDQPQYRAAAGRLQASFLAAGGPVAAATELEGLADSQGSRRAVRSGEPGPGRRSTKARLWS